MWNKLSLFSDSVSNSKSLKIDDFDRAYREMVLFAYQNRFNRVADAKLYLLIQGINLEGIVKIYSALKLGGMLEISVRDAIFSPVGCGDVANAFCQTITGDTMNPSKSCRQQSLTELSLEIETDLPKLIRINIPGHSYVMLACEKTAEGILGYIYQSNVADGMEDNSFSLAAWLMDKRSRKTNLSMHVKLLSELLSPTVFNEKKASIYRQLYIATPIIPVKTPADMQTIISYINTCPTFNFTSKRISAEQMMKNLEQIKAMAFQSSEESMQSLDEFIEISNQELYSDVLMPNQNAKNNLTSSYS
ncbi:hypothetical protein [Legionella waltersii]|uniref:Uncharacterized protein n=1 Tax=Legionella waltersii TaxID=66969 RepID=A0A0W1A4N3_9GAMM|nr:hypothetical protein [Legionella waltersii]KTD76282.1 hypothetical protein Lwal_2004 [Legionella waltersii]SNV13393.1 Uncharacterised protein [Legionella waltersii]